MLGAEESIAEESFENGLLEYSHYTRPQDWNGLKVPEVLLTGHHQNIAIGETKNRKITQQRRPDLWEKYNS